MTPPRSFAALALLLPLPRATAFEIPKIEGHMTDPTHQLSAAELQATDQKLDKIALDTRIDTAGWITDAPAADLAESGKEAYEQWHIGRDWDNGVFLMIPKVGRWVVIMNPQKPELTPEEVARLTAADKPGAPMVERMDAYAETAGDILRAKVFHARPPGKNDPVHGRWYLAGVMLLLLAALVRTAQERRAKITHLALAPAIGVESIPTVVAEDQPGAPVAEPVTGKLS